jgi:DNA-binding beta-propeller fold protein YncE
MTGPQIPSSATWIGDLGWAAKGRFYFADISNNRLDVFSANRLRFVGAVTGSGGPSGIATVGNCIWVTSSDSTVKVVDPRTLQIRASISTQGTGRADDLVWAPQGEMVMVVNSGDQPPFLSFINAATREVAGRSSLPTATDVGQPIWDPDARLFFVPAVTPQGGEILGVSPTSRRVLRTYQLSLRTVRRVRLGARTAGGDHL